MSLASDDIQVFLQELSQLSARHGITIAGCHCCGSPWLEQPEATVAAGYQCDKEGQHLEYVTPDLDEWERRVNAAIKSNPTEVTP